jgi:hypothetical protein
MDSTTLLLVVGPLVLGLALNAVKFMRFVGFVAGGGKRKPIPGRSYEDQMSFDERVAERLRELERGRH